MLRACSILLAALLLAACSGQPAAQSSPTPPTAITLKGGVNAEVFEPAAGGGACSLTVLGTGSGGALVSTLVYTGAVSIDRTYAIVFSLFPYQGAGTYPLGPARRSQVQVLAGGVPMAATGGEVIVSQAPSGRASGTLEATVGASATASQPTEVSGPWHCRVAAPTPAA